MSTYRSQIVGMHFRPPAKAVIEALPSGAELGLEPESGNPYDDYAVRVMVEPGQVPEEQLPALREACSLMGQDWDDLVAAGRPLQLGYVISAGNKKLGAWTPNTVIWDVIARPGWTARLGFDEAGVPMVMVTAGPEAEA